MAGFGVAKTTKNTPTSLWPWFLAGGVAVLFWVGLGWYANSRMDRDEAEVRLVWSNLETVYASRVALAERFIAQVERAGYTETVRLSALKALQETAASDSVSADDLRNSGRLLAYVDVQLQLGGMLRQKLNMINENEARVTGLQQLGTELSALEYRIYSLHLMYNEAVSLYNETLQSIPSRYFARLLGRAPYVALPS